MLCGVYQKDEDIAVLEEEDVGHHSCIMGSSRAPRTSESLIDFGTMFHRKRCNLMLSGVHLKDEDIKVFGRDHPELHSSETDFRTSHQFLCFTKTIGDSFESTPLVVVLLDNISFSERVIVSNNIDLIKVILTYCRQ